MNRTFVLTVAVSLLAACGPESVDPTKPDTTCAAMPAAVTGMQLYTEVFSTRCFSGCHDPGPPAGSAIGYGDYSNATKTLEMIGKTSLYNKAGATSLKIVDSDTAKSTADRLANSTLWLKVSAKSTIGYKGPNGEITGGRMPNDGTMFPATEIQKIKDWICRGAPAM